MKSVSDYFKIRNNPSQINIEFYGGIEKFGGLKDDEYIGDDGFITCSKCGTPRIFVRKEFAHRCMCACQSMDYDKKYQKDREVQHQKSIKYMQEHSLLGERYRDVRFKNTKTGTNETFDNAFTRCRRYCDICDEVLDKGLSIYIYGDKGVGKTHLTACMVNELIYSGKQVLFTNFFEISKFIRNTYSARSVSEVEYIENLATIDFLFLDDIGTEILVKSDVDNWLQGIIFDVINKRYNNKKPTVFTSNHSLKELIQLRGFMPKTVDRIVEMSTAILEIKGQSIRKENRLANVPF